MKYLLLGILYLTINLSVHAQNVYIDPTNTSDNSQDGSQTHPYSSWGKFTIKSNTSYLQKAGTKATANLSLSGLTNTLLGSYGTGKKPKLTTNGLSIDESSGVVIDNLELDGDGAESALNAIALYGNCSSITIKNCEIHGFSGGIKIKDSAPNLKILYNEIYNLRRDGFVGGNSTNIEIAHNYMHDINQAYMEQGYVDDYQGTATGDGLHITGETTFSVHHNFIDRGDAGYKAVIMATGSNNVGTIEDNYFIGPKKTKAENGISIHVSGDLTIRRNIIEDTYAGVWGNNNDPIVTSNIFVKCDFAVTSPGNASKVNNNIFYDNGIGINSWMSHNEVYNNIFYLTKSTQSALHQAENLIDKNIQNIKGTEYDDIPLMDPKFVDAANFDFHLQATSPCINAGRTVTIDKDLDGKAAPVDGKYDIGAYEYSTAKYNRRPKATISAASYTVGSGQSITLAGTASDPDDDELKYYWTVAEFANTLGDRAALSTQFTAPTVTRDTFFYATLVAFDGKAYSAPSRSKIMITIGAVPTISVTGVTVSPATATLNVGAKQQLTSSVLPANATNKAVSWSSSNISVATVSTSGLVTAVAAGTSTITVTTADGSKTATSLITVTASVPVTGVTVSPTTASMGVSATQQLTASLLPANATNKAVTWSSSKTSVATVSANGLVTTIAPGTATITVTTADGNKTATSVISVIVTDVNTNTSNSMEVNMYPNPATDVLNIEANIDNDYLYIYNSLGAKVAEKMLINKTTQFNVNSLQPGFYIVVVKGKNSTISKKLQIVR